MADFFSFFLMIRVFWNFWVFCYFEIIFIIFILKKTNFETKENGLVSVVAVFWLNVFVSLSRFADKILATLGEGTFGKVVKVKDVTKLR